MTSTCYTCKKEYECPQVAPDLWQLKCPNCPARRDEQYGMIGKDYAITKWFEENGGFEQDSKASRCIQDIFDTIKASVPFNEAVRFYLRVPLSERITKTKIFRAECPWCNRGTLEVNPLKKVMWCMECKKGGDLIAAVAEAEGIYPISAALRLIDKYDVEVELCKHECRSTSRA